MLTIDDDGKFLCGELRRHRLYLPVPLYREGHCDGKIEDMTPVVNDANNRIGFYGTYGSLAWDHDKDVLYMIGSSSVLSSSASICITT